jgi:hypothetical protein
MAKETQVPEEAKRAQTIEQIATDINSIATRFNTYDTDYAKQEKTESSKKVISLEAFFSVTKDLGGRNLHNSLEEKQLKSFVASVNQNARICALLSEDPRHKSKIVMLAAKTEATLHGFDADKLCSESLRGNTQERISKFNEAILSLHDKNLSRDEYQTQLLAHFSQDQETKKFIEKQKHKPFDDSIGAAELNSSATSTIEKLTASFDKITKKYISDAITSKSLQAIPRQNEPMSLEVKNAAYKSAMSTLLGSSVVDDLAKTLADPKQADKAVDQIAKYGNEIGGQLQPTWRDNMKAFISNFSSVVKTFVETRSLEKAISIVQSAAIANRMSNKFKGGHNRN